MTRRIVTMLLLAVCALIAQGPPKAELYSGETTKISDNTSGS